MSNAGDSIDRVLVLAAAAVAGLTTGRGAIAWDDLGADDFPYAMAYDISESVEVLKLRQEKRVLTFLLEIVARDATQDAVLAYVDAVRAQITGDRSLNAKADWAMVSGWSLIEAVDDGRRAVVMEILVEETV